MASISCKNCGDQMEVASRPKHSQGMGFFLLIIGVLSIFFIFGLPVGIIFIGIGLYFCCAKQSIWLCGSCKTAIPRVEV